MNIQELLGGGGGGLESACKFPSFSSSLTPSPLAPNILINTQIASTTPSSSSSTTPASTSSKGDGNTLEKNKNNNSSQNNLRCPRCDSTNTKFCYYNNYNLTQPRHFCKTCRRYWTKGGTLRNVPIGGGCRKNKSTSTNSATIALAKAKATLSTELLVNGINPGFLRNGLLDPLQRGLTPTLWPSSSLPQGGQTTSHILSLLRESSSYFPNPNPNPNTIPPLFSALKTEITPTLGSDPYGNGAPTLVGLQGPSTLQNGAESSSNIQELYQKWKSPGNYNTAYYSGNENVNGGISTLGNLMGSSTSSPLKLNGSLALAAAAGAGESNLGGHGHGNGIINSSFSSCWPEFPTVPINGAFP